MFIIPVSHKPDWRRPPWATLLLILANCLIFFYFQGKDDGIYRLAADFYVKSDLPRLELPRYAAYLHSRNQDLEAREFEYLAGNAHPFHAALVMERDVEFMDSLRRGDMVRPDTPDYSQWREQRIHLDKLMSAVVTDNYGFVPARHEPRTYFTCMFLHGGTDHLFGNMVVLAIVGFMVEVVLGGGLFLLFYLASGVGSAALSGLMHAGSTVTEIGASGAIAGAMAMYTVLYGLQRIRFFYFLIFYFDTLEAPAIALLPMFIANEAYQLLVDTHGHVNYMAHIGGLLSGAILAGAYLYARGRKPAPTMTVSRAPMAAHAGDGLDFSTARDQARRLVGALELDKARLAYARLAEAHPDDRELLTQYYHIARLAPRSEEYRSAAGRLLNLVGKDEETLKLVRRTLLEYLRLAEPTEDVPSRRLPTLAVWLARAGFEQEGRRLAQQLLARHPDHPHLPAVLLEVGKALSRKGAREDADVCLRTIVQRFPESREAQLSAMLLR